MSSAEAAIVEPTNPPAEPMRAADVEPCRVVGLTADRQSEWDTYVISHPEGTLFHTAAWRNAVGETFGHKDIYLMAIRNGRIVGGLPVFLMASRIAGRLLVSVPYGVGGGIIADDDEAATALFETAKEVAHKQRCLAIDLRSERAIIPGVPVVDRYVGFRRELPDHAGDVLGWLPRKARAAARNARDKYRLIATFGDEHVKEVWRLYSISMRRLASLTYPFRFFGQLIASTPKQHLVAIVEWKGRPVAGLITFLFKDTVMPYFIGTTDEARQCSATNFIYLSVMMRAVQCGYRVFDFGRSRRDNTGSYNFKRFNGFEPRTLAYQTYSMPGTATPDLSPGNPKFRVARRVWPQLPLCITRTLGVWLARQIPG